MTPRSSLVSRSLRAATYGGSLLLCASALTATLSGCGAQSGDDISTDTGNPPLIDAQRLSVVRSGPGVVVSGEAGAVTGGAEVTVTNTTTSESGSTTASEDGSFDVAVLGSVSDTFQIEAELDGHTTRTQVPAYVGTELDGLSFQLESAEGYTPVANTTIRLSFSGGELQLHGGCNRMYGDYSLCDGNLCCSGLITTAVGCDAERHAQDEWLGTFITSTPAIEHSGDRVVLEGGGATLTFLDDEVANPDRPLAGRTWTIDTFIQGEAASNFGFQFTPTVIFNADGTFQVSTTCTGAEGNYEVEGGMLVLSDVAYAEEPCTETGSQAAHDRILQVLTDGEVEFAIDAARLTLTRGELGLGAFTE